MQAKNKISIRKRLLWAMYSILLIPESFLAFISGIFLSAAINIATSMISDDRITKISGHITFSMCAMFIACVGFMVLATLVSPLQENYKKMDQNWRNDIKQNKQDNPWHVIIKKRNKGFRILLLIVLVLSLLVSILSILALFFPAWTNSTLIPIYPPENPLTIHIRGYNV